VKRVALKAKIQVQKINIQSAIKSLRLKLGVSQEAMADLLGAGYAAYRKWERGSSIPGGRWLIQILRLCPDDETRAAFGLESGIANLESALPYSKGVALARPKPPAGQLTPKQEERLRQFNDAMTGLNLLYEAGEADHTGADQVLADLADKLNARGGNWRRMKYLKKTGG